MTEYLLIFAMGLFGTLHCVGMCGGFIMASSMKFGGGLGFSLAYNAGRVFVYILLGAAMGVLGKVLIAVGLFGKFQGALPVVAGVLMIAMGLELSGIIPERIGKLFSNIISGRFAAGYMKKGSPAPFILGMLNGLVPCAFLYAAGIKAASTGELLGGALTMAVLGAGTFVPLLFTGAVIGRVKGLGSRLPVLISSVIIIALGLKAVLHGTGLEAHLLGIYGGYCAVALH